VPTPCMISRQLAGRCIYALSSSSANLRRVENKNL